MKKRLPNSIYFYIIRFIKPIRINSELDIEIKVSSFKKIIMKFNRKVAIFKSELINNTIINYIDEVLNSINFNTKDIEYFVIYHNTKFLSFINRIFLILSL
jgi:hypothetical protein